MAASGANGISFRSKSEEKDSRDTCLLIDSESSTDIQGPASPERGKILPTATSTPNIKSRNGGPLSVAYSNRAINPMGGGVNKGGSGVMRSPSPSADPYDADPSLDISFDDSLSSSQLSVLGMGRPKSGGSDRSSWTPNVKAMRDKTREKMNQIQNHPAWMSVKVFCGVICFLITVHGALSTGYIMSVLTTIEKRFEIRSATSGLVVSSYEFGSLLSVLFVSYFGSQGHIPRWVGLGGILLAFGSFLFSVPHFLSASPPLFNSSQEDTGPDYCSAHPAEMEKSTCDAEASSAGKYVFILMLAEVLLGVGGSPLFTLGTTYIDNHVPKESSSVYLAFMYVFLAFGPVCGFLLGALMLSNYVNPPAPPDLRGSDPAWIGMWWGGFIICGALYFISSLPFFGFPRKLNNILPAQDQERPTTPERQEQRAHMELRDYGKSLKKIPLSVFRLLTNSVYMVASLTACFDLAIVSGFTVFLPKYLETQFGVSKSNASILTGAVAVPGACVGIFIGGWFLKRKKLQLKGVSMLVLCINFSCLAMLFLFFFFGCSNPDLVGKFEQYDDSLLPNPLLKSKVNLTNQCNSGCGCEPWNYVPVCGSDRRTYFSPCYAGCTDADSMIVDQPSIHGIVEITKRKKYFNCKCVPLNATDDEMESLISAIQAQPVYSHRFGGDATVGTCPSGCNMLYPFLVGLFLLTLVASNNQMPLVMVTLRAVSEDEKAFALGLQVVLLRLLAYIPAPIFFGSVIDTTCMVWKPVCGKEGTTCLLYDIDAFRIRYGSIAVVLKITAALLSVLLWWCIKRRGLGEEPFSPPITMSEIAHRLGDTENLHIRGCPTGNLRAWLSDDSLYSRPRSPRRHQKTMSC